VIGVVVVGHGRLPAELLAAVRAIVGEMPAAVAVSVSWTDDGSQARDAVERAIAEVGGAEAAPVLVLTDVFGGTPTNVSLPFLSDRVEIVTGVNLPMLIKLSAERERPLRELARLVRDRGREAIYVAGGALDPEER
jgi:PTS system mannose-specific IIA component